VRTMERIMKTSLLINPGVPVDKVFECIQTNFFHYPGLVKAEQSFGDPDRPRIELVFQVNTEEVDVLEILQLLQQVKQDMFIVSIEPQ